MSTSPTALPAAPRRSLSFSWRQSKQRRQRSDRLQNNWATGTRCSVSLQPIMITRGQAECPSSGGQMEVVDPAQGLAYSYLGKKRAHIANRGAALPLPRGISTSKAYCTQRGESRWRGEKLLRVEKMRGAA